MTRCDYCGHSINELPYKCKRCGQTFCGNHRLPESHDCSVIDKKGFFKPSSNKAYKKSFSNSIEHGYEMYVPGRKKHNHSHRSLGFGSFLKRYIYPRVQEDVKPRLMQFLLIFLIGLVLNYVYYQTLSLSYLFIGGVNEWFSILIPTINFGIIEGYTLIYLIINGIYYAYFYYAFVLVIYEVISNLDDKDTWVMAGWFALIIWSLFYFFPQIA